MLTILGLEPDFRIETVEEAPVLSSEVEARIAAIWAELKSERGDALFNAPIYALDAHSPSRLLIRRMEYRHLAALKRDLGLADKGLRATFMGVTGVTSCRDGLVLGRRSRKSFFYADMWETAPSGTLDLPDPRAKVIDEVVEELGIDSGVVVSALPRALVFDVAEGMDCVDILFRLDLDIGAEELKRVHARRGTDEYSEIAVVPAAELTAFVAANPGQVIPPTLRIFEWAGIVTPPAAP